MHHCKKIGIQCGNIRSVTIARQILSKYSSISIYNFLPWLFHDIVFISATLSPKDNNVVRIKEKLFVYYCTQHTQLDP